MPDDPTNSRESGVDNRHEEIDEINQNRSVNNDSASNTQINIQIDGVPTTRRPEPYAAEEGTLSGSPQDEAPNTVRGNSNALPVEVATEAVVDQSEVDGASPQIIVTVPATSGANDASRCTRHRRHVRRNVMSR